MSDKPEYETWPFPPTVKNLADKKLCKAIRKGIWDTNGGSFMSRLAPSGMTCKVELPEEALFGIEDPTKRERAMLYWKKYDDMPCNALMATVDALVKLCEDDDGKEALGEIETLRFDLEVLDEKEEDDDKAYVVKREGNTLIVVLRHAYPPEGRDEDPGAWSGLGKFRAKFEAVL